jgi:hypothetical protein
LNSLGLHCISPLETEMSLIKVNQSTVLLLKWRWVWLGSLGLHFSSRNRNESCKLKANSLHFSSSWNEDESDWVHKVCISPLKMKRSLRCVWTLLLSASPLLTARLF